MQIAENKDLAVTDDVQPLKARMVLSELDMKLEIVVQHLKCIFDAEHWSRLVSVMNMFKIKCV